jgi:putative Mg2+ transporter-C (MgtC) family protein
MSMPNNISWEDIALRLVLTVVAATLIGINRSERGRPAGLRTVLLVCLAASVSMIQVNLLLPMAGKAHDSYIVMDLMRLPLGILSGIGFIGGGAILRRDSMVLGVTTAATLWFVTVMGLCFGGGQIGLGLAALGLALVILWALKPIEDSWKKEREAALTVDAHDENLREEEIAKIVKAAGFQIRSVSVVLKSGGQHRELKYGVEWRCKDEDFKPPPFVNELANRKGALKVEWQPVLR